MNPIIVQLRLGGMHHVDSADVSFNKRVLGVGLSGWCVGANVYVFDTGINVNNGEFGGRAINRVAQRDCVSALHPDNGTPLHDERIITVQEEPNYTLNPTSEMSQM